MLSLLCPFLVAVRIFADMLMPLEMRFQFDGREYGNEYLRVPERLEVDDVEDTNDPQRGPVAVIEGWRLVARTRIVQSGWVPDNHVQARGLLVAGEVVNRFMLKFKKVRAQPASHIPLQHRCGYIRRMCTSLSPYPFAQVRLQPHYARIPLPTSICSKVPHDDRRNRVVGGDIKQIKHLRGLLPICEVFAEMLQKIIRLRELRPEDSFEALGLKAESNRGFDVNRKNKEIDYGNQEYPVLLWTMAICCGEVARCLEVLSRRWPSLQSRCNTAYGIVRQADLIEILMSTTRGLPTAMFADQLETLRGVSLPKRHQELCYLMHTVHLLQARLTDGWLKHKNERIHWCVHHACVHPSPPAHHRCGYNRSACTSLSPYPFASQGRLQPKYVYIPLPTFRCSTGAVTTALCVHPSPHVPLQHRWSQYWDVDELAALWVGGDAFVKGQVVTGFWEYFVFDNDLRSSEEPNACKFRLKKVTPWGR
jgi:hypothetical protein